MIPPILFRTVPRDTTEEVEGFWERAKALHPEWDHRTYRDPVDPADFPASSPHWCRCTSGAQLAGLIRLEALKIHGGVYIDSDFDPWRPLDSLLHCLAFAAYEDPGVIPDAVLGAEAGHPAIGRALGIAIRQLGRGAWASGPGVTTAVLAGRDDVLLLPPGSFYPLHYTAKKGADWARVRAENPWAFGAHRWHASWLP